MLNNTFIGDKRAGKISNPKVSTSSLATAELVQETSSFFSHYHIGRSRVGKCRK